MDHLSNDVKKEVIFYDYTNTNHHTNFIKEKLRILSLNKYNHNPDKWYMDVIRYKLDNDVKKD